MHIKYLIIFSVISLCTLNIIGCSKSLSPQNNNQSESSKRLCCTNLSVKAFQRYNFQMKKPTHKIYRTTNWPAYNRALMSRGNIAIWFDPATQWYAPSKGKQGRNQTYSDAAIQCCLMIKSLFRLSLRMVTGFVQSLIKLCGLNWIAPDYTTLCRRQKHIDIVISYQKVAMGCIYSWTLQA